MNVLHKWGLMQGLILKLTTNYWSNYCSLVYLPILAPVDLWSGSRWKNYLGWLKPELTEWPQRLSVIS